MTSALRAGILAICILGAQTTSAQQLDMASIRAAVAVFDDEQVSTRSDFDEQYRTLVAPLSNTDCHCDDLVADCSAKASLTPGKRNTETTPLVSAEETTLFRVDRGGRGNLDQPLRWIA